MDNMILSQIPLDELLEQMRIMVREEMANAVESTKQNSNTQVLKTKELVKLLRISEPTLLRWRKAGIIPYQGEGKSIRYNLDQVKEALKKQNK